MQTFTFSLPQINRLLYLSRPLKTEALFKKKKKKEVKKKRQKIKKKKEELNRRRRKGEKKKKKRVRGVVPEGDGESSE